MMPTREEQEEKTAFWKDKLVGKTLVDDTTDQQDDGGDGGADPVPEEKVTTETDPTSEQTENNEEDNGVLLSSLPSPVRVIKPGSRVTRDLRPHRMNVMCNKDGLIDDVRFF
ncbi:hypothetical protein EV175_003361 [Coemansia sp. RSA 1933]|nr:hypothetical protein EV175_003361 [Coemansia sp. RSA 1933]